METFYSVTCCGKSCGKVSVKRQGLYCLFRCRCIIDHEDFFQLILSCDDFQQSLGILVPDEEAFVLSTRLPVKQLPEGEWAFNIQPKRETPVDCFVPISPEEPFAYISRLKESFLTYQNGEPGITVEKAEE